jgi:hypothetical protein
VPGTELPLEIVSCDVNPAPQDEKATGILPFSSSVRPIDIHPVDLVDSPFASPVTTAITSSSSSSSLASSCGDPRNLWPQVYPGIPNAPGQFFYSTVMGQESREEYYDPGSPHCGLGVFDGNLATPPGLDINVNAPTSEAIPGQYSGIFWGGLLHRPVPERQKSERSAVQMLGPGVSDRRFTCTFDNCGKNFSGEWEKTRHIKSIHCPPTIGCRECNYKQSRKDLFSEHCKKRHPGESIEGLMVQLPVDEPSV